MRSIFAFLVLCCFIIPLQVQAADSLQKNIERIVRASRGTVGVAVSASDDPRIVSVNDSYRFPMQSVFKFHLALTILNHVDRGILRLADSVRVRKEDLFVTSWSPMRDNNPGGEFSLPLSEIMRYTVSLSDNIGCDVLFRLVGGPKEVQRYIRSLGIDSLSIVATEEEMHREQIVQFSNWTSPSAAVRLLKMFHAGKILSESSTSFLRKIMIETSTGPNRLKGLLPAGTVVAHKTGTSGRSSEGVTSAVNDIGIIVLPDGRTVTIAVFVSNSPDDTAKSERVIAAIAKAVWDFYSKKN